MKRLNVLLFSTFLMLLSIYLSPRDIYAHCDGIKGPVVSSAEKALETGNVNYALIWVSKDNEDAVKNLFIKALEVRKLGKNARELADMYFFETLVRLHRSGEGEPYTGLKHTDKDVPEVIKAADLALGKGNPAELLKYFTKEKDKKAVEGKFNEVLSMKNFAINNVTAGRRYVKSYTEFIHFAAELSGAGESEEGSKESHKLHG